MKGFPSRVLVVEQAMQSRPGNKDDVGGWGGAGVDYAHAPNPTLVTDRSGELGQCSGKE